jgi:formamidopyrimidine-DNA glycosylase
LAGLRAHGGSEVKTMGMASWASVSSATKALECAITMQRASWYADPERQSQYETVVQGQPCPNCGALITEITAGQRITNFCRYCQR